MHNKVEKLIILEVSNVMEFVDIMQCYPCEAGPGH